MPTTKRKQRKKYDLELSPLAQEFLRWARKRSRRPRRPRQGRTPIVVAFTTDEAIRWIIEQEPDEWHVGTWDILVEELGFGPKGKKLIHEGGVGKWSLTALCDLYHGYHR